MSIGELSVMNLGGDTKLIWDSNNADEVENARRTFDDLRAKGFTAHRVEGEKGKKGARMREFDPTAERIIMVPVLTAG